MIKLGIFGDSCGRDTYRPDIDERSWVSFVQDTGKYEITNYSVGQSSLWYSYDLFVKHQRNFDKIIFIATLPDRLTLPKNSKFKSGRHHAVEYVGAALDASIELGDEDLIKEHQLVKDYYANIHDREKDTAIHNLMIDNIPRIRPDVILYPSHPFGVKNTEDLAILGITIFENKYFNTTTWKNLKIQGQLADCRNGHITEANAKVLADLLLDRLEGKQRRLTSNDLIPPTRPYDYYLKVHQNELT